MEDQNPKSHLYTHQIKKKIVLIALPSQWGKIPYCFIKKFLVQKILKIYNIQAIYWLNNYKNLEVIKEQASLLFN